MENPDVIDGSGAMEQIDPKLLAELRSRISPEEEDRLKARALRISKVYDAAHSYGLDMPQMRPYVMETKDRTAEDVIAQMRRDIEGVPNDG